MGTKMLRGPSLKSLSLLRTFYLPQIMFLPDLELKLSKYQPFSPRNCQNYDENKDNKIKTIKSFSIHAHQFDRLWDCDDWANSLINYASLEISAFSEKLLRLKFWNTIQSLATLATMFKLLRKRQRDYVIYAVTSTRTFKRFCEWIFDLCSIVSVATASTTV